MIFRSTTGIIDALCPKCEDIVEWEGEGAFAFCSSCEWYGEIDEAKFAERFFVVKNGTNKVLGIVHTNAEYEGLGGIA